MNTIFEKKIVGFENDFWQVEKKKFKGNQKWRTEEIQTGGFPSFGTSQRVDSAHPQVSHLERRGKCCNLLTMSYYIVEREEKKR